MIPLFQNSRLTRRTTYREFSDVKEDTFVERGSSVVKRRTRNQVIPGSNPPLLPFRRLGIFVLSIDAPVASAV